jgi:protein-disulfide isomerase
MFEKVKSICIVGIPLISVLLVIGCSSEVSEEQIVRVVKNNPELIVQIIEDNAEVISESLQEAAIAKYKQDQLKQAFSDLKKPVFAKDRPLMPGSVDDAAVEIAIYSNFSCGYCKTGAELISRIQEKYKGQTKVVFKHSAADQVSYNKSLIFETAGQISPELAWDLHDFMFEHQDQLYKKLDLVNKELGAKGIDLKEFYESMNSDAVISHISADNDELREFEIKGTPTFIVNGVKIEGVIPFDEMVTIIEKTL